jgi:hypothetical protein
VVVAVMVVGILWVPAVVLLVHLPAVAVLFRVVVGIL